MREQLALLPGYLTAHLQLTLFALLAGTAFSIPAGIAIARARRLERPLLAVASVIQTVPSLALLAVMVPLLSALGLRSIGFLPAFIGLTLYSVLPILRNTVTGLSGLDPALTEAARGVGMRDSERLWRVELPLALPVIAAGVRTAVVWTVGAATLATPVGAESLGNYIFAGLQTRNVDAVIVGCLASALLALSLDALARLLVAGLERRSRSKIAAAAVVFAGLYLYSGGALASRWLGDSENVVVIGAKTFTEQYILAEIVARRVRDATGSDVEVKQSLGSSVVFDALKSGAVDAYVDYTGTLWATLMKRGETPGDRPKMLNEISRYLSEQYRITLVCALGFENTYVLAMTASRAGELGTRRVSELGPLTRGLSIGGDYEFFGRPEWKTLVERYGLEFREERQMDASLMYQAVAGGSVDVVSAFSTDGRIAAFGLTVLEDDRAAIPPYDAVLLMGRRLAKRPRALEALRGLCGRIDAAKMRRLNLAVDQEGRSPVEVARAFDGLGGAD